MELIFDANPMILEKKCIQLDLLLQLQDNFFSAKAKC